VCCPPFQLYNLAEPGYPYKKLSVPVLFDTKTNVGYGGLR
jgi:hypothetical protein